MRSELIQSDCIEALRAMKPGSADSIVTDPPYGLSPDGKARTWDEVGDGRAKGGFMCKDWDSAVPGLTWARACLDALKPGGWIAAFSSTRTQHRLTCALEDAGFQIRDVIAVAQFQGFPKSQDASKALDAHFGAEREVVGKGEAGTTTMGHGGSGGLGGGFGYRPEFDRTAPATPQAKRFNGYGTALKPSYEPCILARKPMIGTLAENLLAHGTGSLNIDGCRFAYGDPAWLGPNDRESAAAIHARVAGLATPSHVRTHGQWDRTRTNGFSEAGRWPANLYHAAKPSRGEREAGCESLPAPDAHEITDRQEGSAGSKNPRAGKTSDAVHNVHPTVKPVQAMRWIVRLLTPPGGLCIDPFLGSGTTGIAAALEQRDFIGIEREAEYIAIARARIDHWGRQQQFDFGRAAE
jgi:site-specific DNA-methyltransferase (adenine-specific)